MAIPHALDHLQIEPDTLMDSLRLRLALRLHHIVALGINRQPRILLLHRAKQRVDLRKRLDLIPKQLNPVSQLIIGREDLDYIATYAKRPASEVMIVTLVQYLHQP